MFGKLSKLDKNLLMFLLFHGKLFGFLPYGVDKTSGELIKSTCLQLFNRVIALALVCDLVICSYYWLDGIEMVFQSPKMLVETISNATFVLLSTQGYIFVCTNYETIRSTFNHLWKLNQLANQTKLFSKSTVVQLVLIQPFLFVCFFYFFVFLCVMQAGLRLFALNCSVIFICPARFLMIFFSLMINLTSTLIKSEVENSGSLQSVLKATEKVCKLFNNFAIVYILIEYCSILVSTFGLLSSLIAILAKIEDLNFFVIIFHLLMILNEGFYLSIFFGACGALKANVRCSELTRW
jgi:hypothetical protein